MEIKIVKQADAATLDSIAKIEAEAFGACAWSQASLREFMESPASYMFVAVVDSSIAGYVSVYIIEDEVQIMNIAVSLQSRRRGVGRALLGAVEATGAKKQARTIMLEVRESVRSAILFYESCGFYIYGARRAYYTNPAEDAVLMKKPI